MIILFDPAPPCLQWCLVRSSGMDVGVAQPGESPPQAILDCLDRGDDVEAIGYVLHHGGDQIPNAISPLSSDTMRRLTGSVPLLPEHNSLTLQAARYWQARLPAVPHLLFCDTAFFTRLPPFVRDYAVPYDLTQKGLHRYGGSGLCHEWAWHQLQAMTGGTASNVIHIWLGNHSNLAAIRDGNPLETTVGFTQMEGIMSSTGCGDIDPTIIFQLKAAGFSYSTINHLLSAQSGFSALAGRPCTLGDMLTGGSNPDMAAALRLFLYQIVKQAGAMLAVLGKVDALVFSGTPAVDILPLAREVCAALAFLGIRCLATPGRHEPLRQISTDDSAVKVYVFAYNQWQVMQEGVQSWIQNHKKEAP